MSKLETTSPPWIARLLGLLIVGHDADALRGDLHESFERRVARDGNSFAVRASHTLDVLSSVRHWWWLSLRPSGHSGIAEDVRYGARMLAKHLAFTLVAVISLGVGIGATTTVFSAMNAILLRPLPVKDPASLVAVNKPAQGGTPIHAISYLELLDYRARTNVFSDIVAWTERSASVELDGQPEQAYGVLVSGNYFWVLGGQPALGRVFTAEVDAAPGEYPVVVLSYAFWQGRFGSDSTVIGRRLMLNGLPFTVIGVAPKGFTSTYNVFAPAFYAPIAMEAQLISRPDVLQSRGMKNLKLTARLKPGVSREQAQAALSVVDGQLEREYLAPGEKERPHLGVELVPVGAYPWDIRLAMFGIAGLLVAIVGSVLLIACANVAGMLLARATVRRREIAVRLAVGATRGRLIRQLLTETILLFFIAAALGVALTLWLTRLASAVSLPAALPFAIDAKVDWLVLTFTLSLALFTGIVFGLAPALEGSRVDLHTALKDTPTA
ncbi:MAG TPA: ABC transporter permease, partial [Gemmatimonadaceae bacterium]